MHLVDYKAEEKVVLLMCFLLCCRGSNWCVGTNVFSWWDLLFVRTYKEAKEDHSWEEVLQT